MIVACAALDKSIYHYRHMSIKAALPLDYMRYGRSDVVIMDELAAPLLHDTVKKMDVDIWHLDRFPAQSRFIKYCKDNLSATEYYPYEHYELAVLDTQMTWQEYLASKSKNFRRTYKRMQDSSSSLRTQLFAGDNINVDKIIEDMSSVNAQSWKNDAGTDFSKVPKRMEFFKTLMNSAAQRGDLVASILYDAEKPVAFTFGIIWNDILYAEETGYINEYAEQSAGIMSYATLMKHAFDTARVACCDMDTIRANGDYKKRWATAIDHQINAIILLGGLGSLWIRLGRFIGKLKSKFTPKLS